MSFGILMQQISIIFLEILLGAAGVLAGKISEENSKFLSDFTMTFLVPCLILSCAASAGGQEAAVWLFRSIGILFVFFVVTSILCQLVGKALGKTPGQRAVMVGSGAMPNCGFVGMPLAIGILGTTEGTLLGTAAMTAYNLWFFTYVASLFRKEKTRDLKSLITPCNVATFVTMFLLLTDLRFPMPLEKVIGAVGSCTTPIALMIVGIMLARSDLKALVLKPFLYLITGLRGLLFPGLMILALLLLKLDARLSLGLTIMASCPSGSLAAVLARQNGVEEELCSQAVAHSTLFMLITIPTILLLAGRLFPI